MQRQFNTSAVVSAGHGAPQEGTVWGGAQKCVHAQLSAEGSSPFNKKSLAFILHHLNPFVPLPFRGLDLGA